METSDGRNSEGSNLKEKSHATSKGDDPNSSKKIDQLRTQSPKKGDTDKVKVNISHKRLGASMRLINSLLNEITSHPLNLGVSSKFAKEKALRNITSMLEARSIILKMTQPVLKLSASKRDGDGGRKSNQDEPHDRAPKIHITYNPGS